MLPDVQGAEVRLRYRVAAEQRDQARAAAQELHGKLLAAGAASVKIEEVVIATTRARAPEVARAVTVQDKLRAHWASIGYEPDEATAEALFSKAVQVEEEVRHAS